MTRFRKFAVVAGVLALSLSVTDGAFAKQVKRKADLAYSLSVFNDICLSTAPNFTNAKKRAAKYGFGKYISLGKGIIGSSPDESMNIQITPGMECAMGNAFLGGRNVFPAFVKLVASRAKKMPNPLPIKPPFTALVGSQTLIFHLDRHGGDTFVIINPKGVPKK